MRNLSRFAALTLALAGCQRDDHEDRVPPAAPSDLQASALSSARIAISWTDASDNENGFLAEISSNGLDFIQIADLPADTTNTVISGLAPSTTYYFRVRAYGYRTVSAWSNVASATTPSLAWSRLSPTGTPPAPRTDHAAVYDEAEQRMVVFGGWGTISYKDTWTLDQSPAWTDITPLSGPSERYMHAAAYDPVGRRVIVFGGMDEDFVFPNNNEVWAFDLSSDSWSLLLDRGLPGAPLSRMGHSLVYDPPNHRMILFGGDDGSGTGSNDVWALDLAAPSWTRITPAGTPPHRRHGHSAICDEANRRMIVFGGNDGSPYTNDTWALSLSGAPIWTRLTPNGIPPSARSGHAAIYDAAEHRMFVFGGEDVDISNPTRNDIWVLTLSGPLEWHPCFAIGESPSPRTGHSAVYAPQSQALILFGGWDGVSSYNNEVWNLGL